jgi:hypothetical protein
MRVDDRHDDGDRVEAIAELYRRHDAQLHAVVRKRGSRNAVVVDDACAHAWLKLLSTAAVDVGPPRWSALAWVTTCAVRRAWEIEDSARRVAATDLPALECAATAAADDRAPELPDVVVQHLRLEHVDAWLAHTLPHLVVLRDMKARVSYWGHVTADGVVSTGKGAKVLVPRSQVVSVDQREALLKVAKTQRPSVPWEGSIWLAGSALTPHQLLRHALVVPRLVAPHPNAGVTGGLTPEQAVAMLMQARHNELDRFVKEHQDVPARSDAGESNDWRWRFARALDERLTTSRLNALIAAGQRRPVPVYPSRRNRCRRSRPYRAGAA